MATYYIKSGILSLLGLKIEVLGGPEILRLRGNVNDVLSL